MVMPGKEQRLLTRLNVGFFSYLEEGIDVWYLTKRMKVKNGHRPSYLTAAGAY